MDQMRTMALQLSFSYESTHEEVGFFFFFFSESFPLDDQMLLEILDKHAVAHFAQ